MRNLIVSVFVQAVLLGSGLIFAAEWKAVNTGLTNMDVRSLGIDPVNPSTLYAGTGNGAFKSINGGPSYPKQRGALRDLRSCYRRW